MSAHFHDAGRRFSPADCADSADGFSTRERLARCGRALRLTENWNRRLPRTSPLSESQICEICEICGQTRDATSGLGDGVSRLADPSRELPNGPANVRRRDWQLPGGSADVRRVNSRSGSGPADVRRVNSRSESGPADVRRANWRSGSAPADVRRVNWRSESAPADVRRVNWRSESAALGLFIHAPDLGMVIFSHKPRDFSVMRASDGLHGRDGQDRPRPSRPESPYRPSGTIHFI